MLLLNVNVTSLCYSTATQPAVLLTVNDHSVNHSRPPTRLLIQSYSRTVFYRLLLTLGLHTAGQERL